MPSTLVRLSTALAAFVLACALRPPGRGPSIECTGVVLDGTSGRRLEGARVLGAPEPGTGLRPTVARSDRWGRFRAEVPPGSEFVVAAPGYAPTLLPVVAADARDGETVALPPQPLARGVRLRGRVDDPRGSPAGDVAIEVYARTADGGFQRLPSGVRTVTGSSGTFELADPVPCAPEGASELWILASGRAGVGWRAFAPPLPASDAVEAPALQLRPVAPLTVRVLEEGQPYEGIGVECRPHCAPWDEAGDAALPALFRAHTGADGRARFAALPLTPLASPGSEETEWIPALVYRLRARGRTTGEWTHVLAQGQSGEVALRTRPTEPDPPADETGDPPPPELDDGPLPRGRVVASVVDAASGVPLDPTRAWIETLEPGDAPVADPAVHLQGGGVTVEGLAAGDWILWVAAPAHANGSTVVHVGGDDTQVLTGVELGAPAALAGRVHFGDAPRPEEVVVRASLPDGPGLPWGAEWHVGSHQIADAVPAADGRFRFEGLTPGRHLVRLVGEGLGATALEVELVPGGEGWVDLVVQPGVGHDGAAH